MYRVRVFKGEGVKGLGCKSDRVFKGTHLRKFKIFYLGPKFASKLPQGISYASLLMSEQVKTVIWYYFLLHVF